MKTLVRVLCLAIFSVGNLIAGDESAVLSGVVRDTSGVPVPGIQIFARSGGGDEQTIVSARTGEDGTYSIEVPDSSYTWRLETDDRELLELGFFCVPGWDWEPGDPVVIPELTTVPLRPDLTLVRSESGVSCVRLEFDWADGIAPAVLRQYRIERSFDMKTWEEVITLALGCPPMTLFDETQAEANCGYYRAVPVESVTVVELDPEDFEFVADPNMGWEGDPVLVFDLLEPLPNTPVMAPEIFLREGVIDLP